MNGSAATLSPTCFIETSARLPQYETPTPSSRATFSLADHRPAMRRPSRFAWSWIAWKISVEGVPG
jgi:hypothetical protein